MIELKVVNFKPEHIGQLGFYMVAVDRQLKNEWFRAAAEQGHMYAQFNLGSSYANGDGVPQDMVEAEKWYRKAAEQGHEDAITALKALESGE